MAEKIYCGKGKKGNYSIKLSLCISDLEHHITSSTNGKSYVRLEVSEMRQADKWGNTHTVTVDTWKPKQGDATDHQDARALHNEQKSNGYQQQPDDDQLPF